ncbi:MAG: hypothetical protein WDN45_01950 [Caulobacteraceae bacterium]
MLRHTEQGSLQISEVAQLAGETLRDMIANTTEQLRELSDQAQVERDLLGGSACSRSGPCRRPPPSSAGRWRTRPAAPSRNWPPGRRPRTRPPNRPPPPPAPRSRPCRKPPCWPGPRPMARSRRAWPRPRA